MPSNSHNGNSDDPERLPLRWAVIIVVSLFAGISVYPSGHIAIAIATVAAVAWALHEILD
jgi:hypothetical protein